MRRVLGGDAFATGDWDALVQAFHRDRPGATQLTFTRFRDAQGRTTYDVLAALVAEYAAGHAHVLDLGCGDGVLLGALRALLPQAELYGADYSPESIERARTEISSAHLSVANATALPFSTGQMDVVTAHFALTLMLPIERALEEIVRVLRSQGVLIAVLEALPSQASEPAVHLRRVALQAARRALAISSDPGRWPDAIDALRKSGDFEPAALRIEQRIFRANLTIAEVLEYFRNAYLFSALSELEWDVVARAVTQAAQQFVIEGRVPMVVAIDLVNAKKL